MKFPPPSDMQQGSSSQGSEMQQERSAPVFSSPYAAQSPPSILQQPPVTMAPAPASLLQPPANVARFPTNMVQPPAINVQPMTTAAPMHGYGMGSPPQFVIPQHLMAALNAMCSAQQQQQPHINAPAQMSSMYHSPGPSFSRNSPRQTFSRQHTDSTGNSYGFQQSASSECSPLVHTPQYQYGPRNAALSPTHGGTVRANFNPSDGNLNVHVPPLTPESQMQGRGQDRSIDVHSQVQAAVQGAIQSAYGSLNTSGVNHPIGSGDIKLNVHVHVLSLDSALNSSGSVPMETPRQRAPPTNRPMRQDTPLRMPKLERKTPDVVIIDSSDDESHPEVKQEPVEDSRTTLSRTTNARTTIDLCEDQHDGQNSDSDQHDTGMDVAADSSENDDTSESVASPPRKPANPFYCILCDKQFNCGRGLMCHLRIGHRLTVANVKDNESAMRRALQGEGQKAKAQNLKPNNRTRDELVGQGQTPHERENAASVKEKSSSTPARAKYHPRKHYQCPCCGKTFKNHLYLMNHVRSSHKSFNYKKLFSKDSDLASPDNNTTVIGGNQPTTPMNNRSTKIRENRSTPLKGIQTRTSRRTRSTTPVSCRSTSPMSGRSTTPRHRRSSTVTMDACEGDLTQGLMTSRSGLVSSAKARRTGSIDPRVHVAKGSREPLGKRAKYDDEAASFSEHEADDDTEMDAEPEVQYMNNGSHVSTRDRPTRSKKNHSRYDEKIFVTAKRSNSGEGPKGDSTTVENESGYAQDYKPNVQNVKDMAKMSRCSSAAAGQTNLLSPSAASTVSKISSVVIRECSVKLVRMTTENRTENSSLHVSSDLANVTDKTRGPRWRYVCNLCYIDYINFATLNNHLTQIHKDIFGISCQFCSGYFKNAQQLKSHKKSHDSKKPYQCLNCKKEFPTKQELNLHKRATEHRSVACPYCSKLFRFACKMRMHMNTMHYAREPRKTTAYAPARSKSKANITARRNHIANAPARIKSTAKAVAISRSQHSCNICNLLLYDSTSLHRHKARRHNVSEAIVCTHCNRTVVNKIKYQRHLASSHNHLFPYGCSYCGKRFEAHRIHEYKNHVRAHKNMSKPYYCLLCYRRFKSMQIYSTHIENHFKATTVKGSANTTSSGRLNDVSDHMSKSPKGHQHGNMAAGGERPVKEETSLKSELFCEICNRVFARKSTHTRHMRLHQRRTPKKKKQETTVKSETQAYSSDQQETVPDTEKSVTARSRQERSTSGLQRQSPLTQLMREAAHGVKAKFECKICAFKCKGDAKFAARMRDEHRTCAEKLNKLNTHVQNNTGHEMDTGELPLSTSDGLSGVTCDASKQTSRDESESTSSIHQENVSSEVDKASSITTSTPPEEKSHGNVESSTAMGNGHAQDMPLPKTRQLEQAQHVSNSALGIEQTVRKETMGLRDTKGSSENQRTDDVHDSTALKLFDSDSEFGGADLELPMDTVLAADNDISNLIIQSIISNADISEKQSSSRTEPELHSKMKVDSSLDAMADVENAAGDVATKQESPPESRPEREHVDADSGSVEDRTHGVPARPRPETEKDPVDSDSVRQENRTHGANISTPVKVNNCSDTTESRLSGADTALQDAGFLTSSFSAKQARCSERNDAESGATKLLTNPNINPGTETSSEAREETERAEVVPELKSPEKHPSVSPAISASPDSTPSSDVTNCRKSASVAMVTEVSRDSVPASLAAAVHLDQPPAVTESVVMSGDLRGEEGVKAPSSQQIS